MVIEEVKDLDWRGIGELPGSGVELPGFVGQQGHKADEGGARSLVRLGCDESIALEDPPDGGDRGNYIELVSEVVGDGLRTCVISSGGELVAELEDQPLGFGVDLVGA